MRLIELAGLWRNRRLDPEQLRRVQLSRLKAVLAHAAQNVPFYRELYQASGSRPEDIQAPEDLTRLPIICRQDLRRAGQTAVTPLGPGEPPRIEISTSGYSGEPLKVCLSPAERRRRLLREFRALLAVGFRPPDKLAILGPQRANPRGWHERLGLFRTRIIPAALTAEQMLESLQEFSPDILWVYPTVLHPVAVRAGWRLSRYIRPRILISSSQVFRPLYRERLLADLQAEPFVMYAAMEVGRIGVECPAHNGLHIDADAVYLEILDGQVVVTSLENFTMPIIRYRLGDQSEWIEGECPCGCTFPRIKAPAGRDADMVLLPSGRRASIAMLDYALRGEDWIEQYRFVQEAPGRVRLYLATARRPDETTIEQIRARLIGALEEPLDYEICLVERMPADGAKFKTFVSLI